MGKASRVVRKVTASRTLPVNLFRPTVQTEHYPWPRFFFREPRHAERGPSFFLMFLGRSRLLLRVLVIIVPYKYQAVLNIVLTVSGQHSVGKAVPVAKANAFLGVGPCGKRADIHFPVFLKGVKQISFRYNLRAKKLGRVFHIHHGGIPYDVLPMHRHSWVFPTAYLYKMHISSSLLCLLWLLRVQVADVSRRTQ